MEVDSQDSLIACLTDALQRKSESEKLGQKNVVLFIGRSGNGISTLVQLLAKSHHLYSKGEEGHYYILDKDGYIGKPDNTTVSHTKDVRAVWHGDFGNETCYFDCPGFGNANSPRMDLMCTIATKNALKSRKSVKIILVVSHQEVKSGGQRNAFLDLVQHIHWLYLLYLITLQFVTKVPNIVDIHGGRRQLIPDENIKKSIVEFLENVRNVAKDPKIVTNEKKGLFQNATLLIDILLSKSNAQRTSKIGIMRCPDDEGFLNNNEFVQKSVESLNTLIKQNLQFTAITDKDFGYTVSSSSKASLTDEVQDIIDVFKSNLSSIFKDIQKYYELFENTTTNMDSLRKEFTDQYVIWQKSLSTLSGKTRTSEIFADLVNHVRQLLASKLLKKYMDMHQNILDVPNEVLIPEEIAYFPPVESMQSVSQEKVDLEKDYYTDIEEANDVIKILRLKLQGKHDRLSPICNPKVQAVQKTRPEKQETLNLFKRVSELEKCLAHLTLLEEAVGVQFQHSTSKLLAVVKKMTEFVQNTNTWYTMIIPAIFIQLCSYELQTEKSSEKVRTFLQTLENWCRKNDGAMITEKQLSEASLSSIGIPIKLNAYAPKLRHLLRACQTAFREHNATFVNGVFRVTGVCVALSSISLPLETSIRDIEIFASVRVIIDCDLNLTGKGTQLFIAAPTWEVIGEKRSIVLDGQLSKVGYISDNKCSGSFLGVGIDILNAHRLEISTCACKDQENKSRFSRKGSLHEPKNGFHAGCTLLVGFHAAELPDMVKWNTTKITHTNSCHCLLKDYRQSLVCYKEWFNENVQNCPSNETLDELKSWLDPACFNQQPRNVQQLLSQYIRIQHEPKPETQRDLNALLIYDIISFMGNCQHMNENDAKAFCFIFVISVFQQHLMYFENNFNGRTVLSKNCLDLIQRNISMQGTYANAIDEMYACIGSYDKVLHLIRKYMLFRGNLTNELHIKEYINYMGILLKRRIAPLNFQFGGYQSNNYF